MDNELVMFELFTFARPHFQEHQDHIISRMFFIITWRWEAFQTCLLKIKNGICITTIVLCHLL